jgi:hypothetical protein
VHAVHADGTQLVGWPVRLNPLPHLDPANGRNHRGSRAFASGDVSADVYSSIIAAPGIADLDGDRKPELVVATADGWVYVLGPDGSTRHMMRGEPAFSAIQGPDQPVDLGFFAAPVLEDLDGDGKLEIIVAGFDGHVYVWKADGTVQPGFPVELFNPLRMLKSHILSTPAVGDIDGDGRPEIVMGRNNQDKCGGETFMGEVYAVHHDGNDHAGGPYLAGWDPNQMPSICVLPLVGTGIPNAPAMADIDGDGNAEVAINGVGVAVNLLEGSNGQTIRTMNNSRFGRGADSQDKPSITLITNPAFGDLDNDGDVDVLQGAAGFKAAEAFATGGLKLVFDHHLNAWDATTGEFLEGFPRRVDDWQFFMNPLVADVDGDGLPEAINGSAGYMLRAWNYKGAQPAGWPKFAGGWIAASPAVGDVDGDGTLDVAVNTRNGWLLAWRTRGRVNGRIDWASFHHDNRNTGNLMNRLDIGMPAMPTDGGADAGADGAAGGGGGGDGCGCRLAGDRSPDGPAAGPIALAGLLLGATLRRRRRRT